MIAQKVFSFISKETGGLHKAAYVLALFTFASQIIGLVRDRLLAYTFGASETLDIYYAAFRIPDLVLIVGGSIVSLAVIVPMLTSRLDGGTEEGKRFLDSIFTFFFLSIAVICAVLFFLAPVLLAVIFPGFALGESFADLVLITRIFLLSPILLGISNIFSGVVQVYRRFFIYALSPILYNIGIIAGIILLYPYFGITGLALGVVLGALLHMLVQMPFVRSRGLVPDIRGVIDWKIIRSVLASSIPRSFTLSITSLVVLFLLGFGSLLGEGAIAIFTLALNLQSVPLSIIGVSYSLAAFPILSALYVRGERVEFKQKIETAARHIIFWSLPIVALFIVLRAHIVRVILGAGEFSWSDTRLTAATLALLVLSVFAQSLALLFVRGYYATGDTKKPLIYAVLSGGVVIASALIFFSMPSVSTPVGYFLDFLLNVENVSGSRMLFLPLSFSIGMFLNALLLFLSFSRDFGKFSRDFWKASRHSVYISIISGISAFQALRVFDDMFNVQTVVGIFAQGLFSGIFGLAVGVLALLIIGNDEIRDVLGAIKKSVARSDIILPEQSEL